MPTTPTLPAVRSQFGFEVDYIDENEQALGSQRLENRDFAHAVRETRFDAFRLGLSDDYLPSTAGAGIEPVFPNHEQATPRAEGFHVSVTLENGRAHRREFNLDYFRQFANLRRAEMLRREELTSEQELYFRLNAFLDDDQAAKAPAKLNISLEPAGGISTTPGSRRDFGRAEPCDDPIYADMAVLVDRGVLEESVEEAREDPEREIAGFLLGKLHRDVKSKEVFLAVTGLASAAGTTEADATSVTYTPASFAHAREMIQLRGAGEVIVGWYHSHPFRLCAECPLPTPPECLNKILFYSQDDIHLMETTFEQPYMVGLLAAVEPRIEEAIGHLPVKLYGWRDGQIQQRGFEIFDVRPPTVP